MPAPHTPSTTSAGDQPQLSQAAGLDLRRPLPAVLDLTQAAALLGVGRTTAYRLVHDQQWPTPVLRLGRLIKIPTQPLLDLLAGSWPSVDVDEIASGTAGAVRGG
jgi:excisionase family DNA binding protein